ncbi:hypothetical protein DM01DRAFT_1369043 [Hesseltinella vesiculosa]|uniref:EF-hand domain-containing protein n=1 Tax=Hesseltinella vesiculosa TaxID=101127 RepID=A0A1X2G2G7_9FUNG|nr:hypothetical protein DM01DRAFT_1369043 [Hesseltinella vesiculosa]
MSEKVETFEAEDIPVDDVVTGTSEYEEDPQGTTANSSAATTTDDDILLEDGLTASIPLSSLAGPALVAAPDLTLSGEDEPAFQKRSDNFDWTGRDDEDDDDGKKGIKHSRLFICLSKNSSYLAWTAIIFFALCLIAVDVAIFIVYREDITMVSYNLQLWFSFLAFMWCIGFFSQVAVELLPWAIKKIVGYLRPQNTEVLRMRLSYYMALRSYVKFLLIVAWGWGSWSFIIRHVPLPDQITIPYYATVITQVWQCFFFAALLVFIEKFILQLIVTSFHKKAYGNRIENNDRALKVLDKLKKVKRKTPQQFLLTKIGRKAAKNVTKNVSNLASNVTHIASTVKSRSHSMDHKKNQPASIINTPSSNVETSNSVRFPPQNVDTLIAIPPLDQHQEDYFNHESDGFTSSSPPKYHLTGLTKKLKGNRKREDSLDSSILQTPPGRAEDVHPRTEPDEVIRSTGSQDEARSSSEQTLRRRRPQMISRDHTFLNSTTAIPGKLLKGGYKKIKSNTNNRKNQSTSAQAKSLAKRIYYNLMGPDPEREHVVESDLYPYFRTQDEASSAFRLFDVDDNGDISKRELRSGCIRIYRERKNLARSMRDLSQATGKMDIILLVVFTAIWMVIVCASFGINVGSDLYPLWTAFIAASFIFGNTAKETFDSVIFVFVTHPFDAGDRVFIGTDNFTVDNVGLLVTTFIKWDGSVVYVKNSVLSTHYIINVRRAGPMGETIALNVDFKTPTWKIHQLREHMFDWCNQFPKMYTPNCASLSVVSVENQNKLDLSMYFCHASNWQDAGDRSMRHNNFMYELKDECERLGVNYSLPRQPIGSSDDHGTNDQHHPLDQSRLTGDRLHSEGLQRPPRDTRYRSEDDEDDDYRGHTDGNGGTNGGAGSGHSGTGNAGAEAGAAATMMFATAM